MDSYVSGSPVDYKIEYLCKVRNKTEETIVECMILQILSAYTVKNHLDNDREWVFGLDLETIKKEMNECVQYLNTRREKYDNLFNVMKEQEYKKEETKEDNVDEEEKEDEETKEEDKDKDNDGEEEKEDEETKEENNDKDNDVEEKEDENDEEHENIQTPKESISKYDVDLSTIGIKRNDPINFEQFIIDFCVLGEDLF